MSRPHTTEIEQQLRPLLMNIDQNAWKIGKILATSFLTEAELVKLAETLGVSLGTLTEYRNTVLALGEPMPGVSFAFMAELARISDGQAREHIWQSRPQDQWTLLSLKAAVDAYLRSRKSRSAVQGRARSATAAEYDSKRAKAIVTVTAEGLTIDLETSVDIDWNQVEIAQHGSTWRHTYPWK